MLLTEPLSKSHPLVSRRALRSLLLVAGLSLGSFHSQGVDIFSPEMHRAPEAVKRAYVDKIAKESAVLQREVGRKRFEARLALKQAILEHAKTVAMEARSRILNASGTVPQPGAPSASGASFLPSGRWILGLMFLACAVAACYKFIRTKETVGP